MLIKKYTWQLINNEREVKLKKYCPHCKKTVMFTDSLKRRRNANGKSIFEFAIYKCEKDHTWNKKIAVYKANQYDKRNVKEIHKQGSNSQDSIPVLELKNSGIEFIVIYLKQVKGRWRLDKLLEMSLLEISRSKIKKWIRNKYILVNGQGTKAGFLVRSNHMISIRLKELPEYKLPGK